MWKTNTRLHARTRPWVLLALAATVCSCAVAGGMGYLARTPEEKFVVQTVKDMADALNEGDVERFMSRISPGFYRGYGQLEKRVTATLADRRDLKVDVQVSEMRTEDAKVLVTVSWKNRWVSRASGQANVLEGSTRLFFITGVGLKLLDHSGELLLGF